MKVLLSGGGTAGHTTPLIAVAKELVRLEPSTQLFFLGQKNDKSATVIQQSDLEIDFSTVHAGKFRRYSTLSLTRQVFNIGPNLQNARDFLYVLMGFVESFFYLLFHRPDVIFFKGGYVVVPIGYAARVLRIPYITHDSDSVPGLANRLIAKGARYNAVASESVKYYPADKSVAVGIPISQDYFDKDLTNLATARAEIGCPEGAKMLFVYLGTQGAKKIDDLLDEQISTLLHTHPDLHVFHVFGRLNESTIDKRYNTLTAEQELRVYKLTFVSNAHSYIAAADLILARAGATTMAEFAAIGRACVIIPADQLTGGHQVKNALLLEKIGAISVVRESDMHNGLISVLSNLLGNKSAREGFASHLKSTVVPDSAERIARLLIKTGQGR
jgi:UDP-N-acetylglucosamine--N-acetylmuramyl-(pentapeptide) pyrophosphoryl-undecaprenol N-acetylglucosamine transferase